MIRSHAATATCLVAAALFASYGVDGGLSRDEAVYVYAGQRLADGVPLAQGIFDPKGPLGSVVLGAVAALPGDDVVAARVAFWLLSLGVVLAVLLLARRLTGSLAGGVVAALVLACAQGFARDALSGPDVKTLGLLLLVLALHATVDRRWFLASLAGCAAALTWQPLAAIPLTVLVLAALERRARPVLAVLAAGCASVAPVLAHLLLTGALDDLVDAAVAFPLTGMRHADATLGIRLGIIRDVVLGERYGVSGVVVVAGLVPFVAGCAVAARRRTHERAAAIVPVSFLAALAMTLSDFQGYPDLYPLLPYGALGWAWAVAALRASAWARPATVAAAALTAALVGLSAVTFPHDDDRESIDVQRRTARWVDRLAGPDGTVWALGDPTPLVLTGRANPDPYVFLSSGVAEWKLARLPGGVPAWRDQVLAAGTTVVVVNGVTQGPTTALVELLREDGFRRCRGGIWKVYSRVGCPGGPPRRQTEN